MSDPVFFRPALSVSVADIMSLTGAKLFGRGDPAAVITRVMPLDFEDHPFERTKFDAACEFCGATDSFLDEVVVDDKGGRMFVCSDTDYCEKRLAAKKKDAAL